MFNLSREAVEEWGDDEPDEDFIDEVKANFQRYFGQFVTRSLMDLATIVAPMARLLSSDLWKVAFNDNLETVIARGRHVVIFNEEALAGDQDDNEVAEIADLVNAADQVWAEETQCGEETISKNVDLSGDAIIDSDFFSLVWTLAACGFTRSTATSGLFQQVLRNLSGISITPESESLLSSIASISNIPSRSITIGAKTTRLGRKRYWA